MFKKARPVFLKGKELSVNLTAGFRNIFDYNGGKVVFRAAAQSIYRLIINGALAAHGPARCAHGYYRVDEIDITPFLKEGKNVLAIEVAGYNCASFYIPKQPSFLQAEIEVDGIVSAATGVEGFSAMQLPYRVRNVQRFSIQRTFAEFYKLDESYEAWKCDPEAAFDDEPVCVTEEKKLIERGIPNYVFEKFPIKNVVCCGSIKMGDIKPQKNYGRHFDIEGWNLDGFKMSKLETVIDDEVLALECTVNNDVSLPYLKKDTYAIVDFGLIKSGFISFKIKCSGQVKLLLSFDELLTDNDVNFMRIGFGAASRIDLMPGEYEYTSIEPYTMRYLKIAVLGEDAELCDISIIPLECSEPIIAKYEGSDLTLKKIFDAGVETFKQNAVDIFMDCPSRERAGWLCDSFFTGRVEKALTGRSDIERNFIRNYFLAPKNLKNIPEGMQPMCYPSDAVTNEYIPNWVMWLILEIREYLGRTGDRQTIDDMRQKVYAFIKHMDGYLNDIGLIEKLDSWVFIEWSKAAEFVQDVSFPTNMLYARTLRDAGFLYGDESLIARADAMEKTIRELAYRQEPQSGKMFFADHAVRREGKLVVLDDFSEANQYYAFFLGTASPDMYKALWDRLINDFGPQRQETGAYPMVWPANSFIGNYLRLDMLRKNGMQMRVEDEIKGYFENMADMTGTLWEHDSTKASCCHGFASHICCWLLPDGDWMGKE